MEQQLPFGIGSTRLYGCTPGFVARPTSWQWRRRWPLNIHRSPWRRDGTDQYNAIDLDSA